MLRIARALLLFLAFGTVAELASVREAEARAGRGRSSSGSSGFQRQPSDYGRQPAAMPAAPQAAPRGGFMRSMAGGIAGGFLGSMLFSSMGHAAGAGGAGGGGIGLLEIVLFAGLAFLLFRWWKSRQQAAPAVAFGRSGLDHAPVSSPQGFASLRALQPDGIDPEAASELFFKVQGAWTRRDLSSIREILGDELRSELGRDVEELKAGQRINRLENITVRRSDVVRSWHEDGLDLSTVRFAANLLDYTVDERTGQLVDGSDTSPVRFEEEWTFARSPTRGWHLVRIDQV
jgi:predicted lipid-binding transport protein (Tim44 family)